MSKDVVCKEVIITKLEVRGAGTAASPGRRITQVWEKDGTLIAEHDILCVHEGRGYNEVDMLSFATYCNQRQILAPTPQDLSNWKKLKTGS